MAWLGSSSVWTTRALWWKSTSLASILAIRRSRQVSHRPHQLRLLLRRRFANRSQCMSLVLKRLLLTMAFTTNKLLLGWPRSKSKMALNSVESIITIFTFFRVLCLLALCRKSRLFQLVHRENYSFWTISCQINLNDFHRFNVPCVYGHFAENHDYFKVCTRKRPHFEYLLTSQGFW